MNISRANIRFCVKGYLHRSPFNYKCCHVKTERNIFFTWIFGTSRNFMYNDSYEDYRENTIQFRIFFKDICWIKKLPETILTNVPQFAEKTRLTYRIIFISLKEHLILFLTIPKTAEKTRERFVIISTWSWNLTSVTILDNYSENCRENTKFRCLALDSS